MQEASTVPTLCATGSIIGAASLGFAFAQSPLDPLPSTPNSSTTSPARWFDTIHKRHGRRLFRTSTSSSIALTPSRPITPLPLFPNPSREDVTQATSYTDPTAERLHRESRPASQPTRTLQRQPSRLKQRLSSWSVSLGSSPSARDQRASRSIATSAGSEQPFVATQEDGPRLPRNKLVKRSLSQHIPNGDGREPTVRTHTLDRPATRHKRIATLSGDWSEYARVGSSAYTNITAGNMLPPYFNSSMYRDDHQTAAGLPRTMDSDKGIRRILPRSSPSPALCLSTQVTTDSVGVQQPLDLEDRPFEFGRRPSSSGLKFFFSSPVPALHVDQLDPDLKPRSSTSVNNILSISPTIKDHGKKLRVHLRGRRVVSAPASTMLDETDANISKPTVKRRHVDQKSPKANGYLISPTPMIASSISTGASANISQHEQSSLPHSPSLPTPPSYRSFTSGSRRSHSAAYSDMNSSRPGSESDGKVFSSADEDEMRSDTAYDSVRTGMTKSSTGYHGPALETLFDKDSPPPATSEHGSPFQFFNPTTSPTHLHSRGQTNLEEDSSTSTPGRTVTQDRRESHDRDRSGNVQPSPASTSKALNLGQLSWDSDAEREEVSWPDSIEEGTWDDDEDPFGSAAIRRTKDLEDPLASVRRKLNFLNIDQPQEETEPRNNLFDWAEPVNIDRGLSDSPPPRPKTVHGKKNTDVNGSRADARRAPSGLHARSHSVPVLADLAGQRSNVTSKFGTWGIGSKGVTEDWNDDFAFDDEIPDDASGAPAPDAGSMNKRSQMIVPDTIKAQQTSVLANIGLLKEWGMLIDELKELRIRASGLGIDTDRHTEVFDNVAAMIELADQEAENERSRDDPTPTSSPGFDSDDEHQSSPSLLTNDLTRRSLANDSHIASPTPTPLRYSFASRVSIESEPSTVLTRPRKNSEAVAQSVIQALQSRRHQERLATPNQKPLKKIPFDTKTLRKIVPYVSGLVKSVKQIVKEAEGLHASPKSTRRSPDMTLRGALFSPPHTQSDNWFDEDSEESK